MRSPSEFAIGHILGAINIPIFSDEERIEVGTVYRQVGIEPAKELGLSIASGKLPIIVSQIQSFYKTGRSVIVYCWRGGMRSKSIVTVLNLMGIQALQLVGGYKAYRRHVLDCLINFKIQPKIIVLCGSTGVGKTSLLQILKGKNIPVIDLEKLANHRGSVFGKIGLGQSTTAHFFDANLLAELECLNEQSYIIVECESKRIGNVYLPECLCEAMRTGIQILVHTNIETRISRLIAEYTDFNETHSTEIVASLRALTKRLGAEKISELLSDFDQGNLRNVVSILLTNYYDPLYGYDKLEKKNYSLAVNCNDLEVASIEIIDFLGKLGG